MAQELLAREYMEENTIQLLSEECMFWESVQAGKSTKIEMYQMPASPPSAEFDTKVA